jgi:ubiquinone/menaquinone biosynthesis C-methylase UbiE
MGLRAKLFARFYDRMMASTEEAGLAEVRSRLLAGAAGDVLEVGAGTGVNLRHYGDGVGSLTMTEPDESMLRQLERAAARADRDATVLRAPAEDLPFDDDTFDTVVSTLVLCGVSDQPRAAREITRVLRPGGRVLFVEHVRSSDPRRARQQDRLNWLNRAVAGCDCNRPTLQTLRDAGLTIDDLVDGELPKSPPFVRPMISGAATCSPATATSPPRTPARR